MSVVIGFLVPYSRSCFRIRILIPLSLALQTERPFLLYTYHVLPITCGRRLLTSFRPILVSFRCRKKKEVFICPSSESKMDLEKFFLNVYFPVQDSLCLRLTNHTINQSKRQEIVYIYSPFEFLLCSYPKSSRLRTFSGVL